MFVDLMFKGLWARRLHVSSGKTAGQASPTVPSHVLHPYTFLYILPLGTDLPPRLVACELLQSHEVLTGVQAPLYSPQLFDHVSVLSSEVGLQDTVWVWYWRTWAHNGSVSVDFAGHFGL